MRNITNNSSFFCLLYKILICFVFNLFCFHYTLFGQEARLDPSKKLTDYSFEMWNSDNGMPYNSVLNLVQTQDGYLLLSSFDGLVRFDGLKFEHLNKKDNKFLKTNAITAIAKDQTGMIWVSAIESGIFKINNWKFEIDTILKDFKPYIEVIYTTSDGKFLIGTRGNGLYIYDKNKINLISEEQYKETNFIAIEEIGQNEYLIGTEGKGLLRLKNNKLSTLEINNLDSIPKNIYAITKAKNGKVWLASNSGVYYIHNKTLHQLHGVEKVVCSGLYENDNVIFVAAMNGLYRWNDEKQMLDKYTANEGLPFDDLRKFCMDKEGSLWVSTYKSGIFRLRNAKFSNISSRNGIANKPVNAIIEIDNEKYLFGNDAGTLSIFQNGKVSEFKTKTTIKDKIKCLFKDKKGNLWIGTYGGILKVEPKGKEITYDKDNSLPDNQVRVFFEDSQNTIWVGFRNGGIVGFKADGTLVHFDKKTGLSSNFIMDISEDKLGNLIVATNTNGIDIISKRGKIQNFNTANGLSNNMIFRICVDSENSIWLSAHTGLTRIKNGKASIINAARGLDIEAIYDIKEDKLGYFWISSNKGVLRILKKICEDVADGKIAKITYKLYNKADGMVSDECNGTGQNLFDSKEQLWFTTLRGLSYVNTRELKTNEMPPNVLIEYLKLDDKLIPIYQNESNEIFEISAETQRIAFGFVGLSLIAPDKIDYQYQLEGFDNDILQTNSLREISYTNLPAGTYTFFVNASNNDGLWSKKAAKITIVKKAFFYQTLWFYALVLVFVIVSFVAYYRYRLRAIEASKLNLARLVELRTAEINLQKEELLAQRDRIEEQKFQIEKSYQKINIVSEIGQKVTAVLDFSELLDVIYIHANTLLKAEGFGIGMINHALNRIDFKGFIENNEKLPFSYDGLHEIEKNSVKCFLSKEMVLINDLLANKHQNEHDLPNAQTTKIQSLIYLPLIIENVVLGVITVQSFEKNAYKDYHVTSFQALASYIAIALSNTKAYEIINEKNKNITDSIRYAMTIQQAILPKPNDFSAKIKENFVLFLPKDIVSGDFYWTNSFENHVHFAVVDCTGHGVPGAFMSLIGNMLLNEIVNILEISQPDKILETLDLELRKALSQAQEANSDGMDVCLCSISAIDNNKKKIAFSGAKRPLYYTLNNELIEIKGSKKSIGGNFGLENIFEVNVFEIPSQEMIYLTTDGFCDQANDKRLKFGSSNLKKLFLKMHKLSVEQQKEDLLTALKKHQENATQRDDITIVGIRI